MVAKTPKARHQRFLKAGFFPPEMPSCFYSETFAPRRDTILKAFVDLPKKGKLADYYSYVSGKAVFTFPRYGREDRRHAYINPISFFFLSKVLADNYVKLRALNRKSKLSVAPSVFDWSGRRALSGPVFGPRNSQQSSLNARFALIAEADIQAFYHSVYTHAIAWAIHGKAVAKKNQHDLGLYGNAIDRFVRNAQDRQTIGIPVGPDTSRLIGEVMGSAIDKLIQKSLKLTGGGGAAKRSGMRFVDDFTFGCNTHQEADRIVAVVRSAANAFELELNNSKTGSRPSAPTISMGWRDHLRDLLPLAFPTSAELNRYFYNVQIVARDNPRSDVVKYALLIASRALLDTGAWPVVQDYLFSAYRQSGTAIQQLVELTTLRHMARADVQLNVMADFVNSRIPALADLLKNGEITWLLLLAISLKLTLDARVVSRLTGMEDGAIALLMSDARRVGIVPKKADFSIWESTLKPDALDGPMWLYAYEGARLSINGGVGDNYVKSHRYFQHLLKNKVVFYRTGLSHLDAVEIWRSRRLDALRRRMFEQQVENNLAEDVEDFEEEDEDVDQDDIYA
jgi:hypothetical protein